MRINEEIEDRTSGRNLNLCNKFNRIFKRGVAQLGSALGSGPTALPTFVYSKIIFSLIFPIYYSHKYFHYN